MIEFTVKDMTCGHCASRIARAVKEADAAATCDVDLREKRVRISGSQSRGNYADAIRDAGYTPESLLAEASP